MNRRGFFASLAAFAGASSLSPLIFIPKFEPVHWKSTPFTRCSFTSLLLDQSPIFDEFIIMDMTDPWIKHVEASHWKPVDYHIDIDSLIPTDA